MTRPVVLIYSPQEHWPEPVRALVAKGLLAARHVRSCHQLAAELALAGRAADRACCGILVDAQWLSRREVEMMPVIQRHTGLPIWTLPATHPGPEKDLGLLPWKEALRTFARFLAGATTRDVAEGSSTVTPVPDNSGTQADNPLPKAPEIPLATEVAARYDGLEVPLLSRSEIAALLGISE